jgi:tetratricopeptide (TPR) repeat protein
MFLCALLLGVETVAQQEDKGLAAARSLILQNRNAEAIDKLKALAASHPGMKGVSRELGIAYYHEVEYLEAAKYLQEAWQDNPEDHDAAQLLGLAYYSSGKPAEAIPALEKVRMWHPNESIDAIYILGLCYILTRNYPKARQTFTELYGLRPDSAEAHVVLARMLLRQGFDPVAEEEARKALSLSQQLPLAHFTLGEFEVYKADYPMAAKEFESELTINPSYALAHTSLADVYFRLGRYDDAERVVQRSIWLDSTDSKSFLVMGKVLFKKSQLAAAERALQHAISLEPGSYNAHYFLGQLYREEGKADDADRELKAAAKIHQQRAPNAHRN